MQKYGAEREKLKDLLAESIRLGISLDAKFNEGNTLLHFAVALDMYEQVVYLLEAGANYLITNKEGLSPRDIALEAGNQRVLCLFRRESCYRLYTYAGNEKYNPDKDSRELNSQALSQIAQPAVGFADISYTFWMNNGFVGVSENFLDWTDSQICTHLQDLLELFRVQEQKFLGNLETMQRQREASITALSSMHQPLRNHEHKICRRLFTVQELVRQYRDKVNAYAEEKMTYKQEIRALREKVYYHSVCEQRVHNGYLVKLWKYCSITVTGEYLIISDGTSLSAAAATASTDGPCTEGDQDVSGGSDCCRQGRHRIPVRDIYHVETLRSGFHSSTPSVSFGITLRQRDVKDCRHLQTISTTSSSPPGSAEKAHLVKLRKLTISIPAVPLDKEKRPLKSAKISPPAESSGADGFPIKLGEIASNYFDDFACEDKRRAHVFLLALRATSHKIRFGGNYLPPGWASLRRRSSASREHTPASDNTSPGTGAGVQRKGKIENFLGRIFSNDRDCVSTPTSVSSTPATGTQSASRPRGAYNSAEKHKAPSSVPREIERPSVSEDEARRSMSQRGTATSRESTSTQQSHSYSSTASASSLPRLSLLHKSSSGGSSTETSRNSGTVYADSGRDSSFINRPSVAPADATAGGYAHTCLETVAEREERQFSSDSEGQFSCKLAAHLAGIVAESVAEPTVSGYGLRRKRSSSSIASNVDTSSMCSGTASASGGLADTPPLGWEIVPDHLSPRATTDPIPLAAPRTVHYEDSRESSAENADPTYRPADMLSSSAQEVSYLTAAGGTYDVESLSEPSLLRSKSLPFKLPSSDCLAGSSDDAAGSGDDRTAGPRHLADIDAEELQRVTAAPGGREDYVLADWRSVASASEVVANTVAATEGFEDVCLSEESGHVPVHYTTPEKTPRPSFMHPLLSPCTQEGIDVRTTEGKCTSFMASTGNDNSGHITPPSIQSDSEIVRRARADSGWDTPSEDERVGASIEETTVLKIMQCPSTDDSVSLRIKNDMLSSPTALLVRATPDSPACSDGVVPSPYPGGVPHQLSPLLRKQKKTPVVSRCDAVSSGNGDSEEIERQSVGANRRSAASNTTDPPDDFGHFAEGSMSHHSAFEADRLSLLYSPRYSTLSGVGGFRDTLGSMEDEMMLGMIYDPDDPCKPTSRMTIAAGSPPTSATVEQPSRRISGLCLLPCGGIDSPSILKAGLGGPPITTPISRIERASFCCGSAQSTLSSKQEAIQTLKKEPSPGAPTRRGSHMNKMMRFRTLEDVMKALAKIRDISAVGEERLSIALNDREVEHQKFTYLLALRGIVDHLPRVEDRIQFLSGSGRGGGVETSLPGHVVEDSPGGNSGTGYNMNSSHSATAILAAATASFAAANSSCNNTMIGDDDCPRSSIHSMSGRYSLDSASSGDLLGTGLDCNDAVGSDCRVMSKDFTDMTTESIHYRKFDACVAPSPLLLASAKSLSTVGTTEDARLDSVSASRLSSVDRESVPVSRRSISKSSGASAVTPHRGSLGPSDRPSIAGSPSFGGGLFKQLSEDSVGAATSTCSPDIASRASLKEYISERFGAEIAAACDVHALPPVTAVLCVPMGQPPDELLDKYNTVFSLLKSIYSLDKAIFDHLQRLAELCQLKDDLRNRYWSLQNQANKVSAPRAGDLYDVDL